MITENINLLELCWSLVLAVGIMTSSFQLYQVIGDLRARIGSRRNGTLMLQARNEVSSHILRTSVLISLSWFAYRALTLPNREITWTAPAIISTLVFIWIPLALTVDAIRTTATRKKIIDELEHREIPD